MRWRIEMRRETKERQRQRLRYSKEEGVIISARWGDYKQGWGEEEID